MLDKASSGVYLWHTLTQGGEVPDPASMRTSMNVSLPPSMKEWVDNQVQTGGYETASEYVRQLLREEQKRQAQEKLETLLVGAQSLT